MATKVDQEIEDRLTNFAGLTALAQHIRWGRLAQDDVLPAVVLQWTGGGYRDRAMGTDTGDVRARLQASCWAERYDVVVRVAEQVRLALTRFPVRDAAYAGDIQDVYLDNEIDLYEEDTETYHRALDFEVVYTETPA